MQTVEYPDGIEENAWPIEVVASAKALDYVLHVVMFEQLVELLVKVFSMCLYLAWNCDASDVVSSDLGATCAS